MPATRPLATIVLAALVSAAAADAQSIEGLRAGVARDDRANTDSVEPFARTTPAGTAGLGDIRLRRLAPIASAVLPGSGQLALGNDRFVVYAATEIIAWWRYSKNAREQTQQEGAFKAIARTVARSHFSTAPPDGDWTYYESMRDFLESGAYTTTNTGTIVPETDTLTYNGHLWQQALATNATTAAALAVYQAQAIKPNFQWSWRNAQLQYDQFKRTTDKRNDANHAAVQDLIMIAANHVLSMVDAFATFRLQIRPAAGGGASLGASAAW
jgi:hypothetical protein